MKGDGSASVPACKFVGAGHCPRLTKTGADSAAPLLLEASTAACPTIPELTLRYALQELNAGARETGGNNMGPWVRKYMGWEGAPWCVGFATWCYRQACRELGVEPLLTERYSSSRLLQEAERKGIVVSSQSSVVSPVEDGLTTNYYQLTTGCFFIVPGGPTGWRHTGIVRTLESSGNPPRLMQITTVEGNTQIPGETGRDRVVSRRRTANGLVFVVTHQFENRCGAAYEIETKS